MIRKVKTRSELRCVKCCYKDKDECASVDCCGGYFTDKPSKYKRTRLRKSRDRRLLESILQHFCICESEEGERTLREEINLRRLRHLTKKQEQQLIAIKEAMERKGGGK